MQIFQLLAASFLVATTLAAGPGNGVVDTLREKGIDVIKYFGLEDLSKQTPGKACPQLV